MNLFNKINILRFRVLLLVFTLIQLCFASENEYFIRGIVKDSVSDNSIPHAFVTINKGKRGTTTDENGIFELTVPNTVNSLTVTCQGYRSKTIDINKNKVNLYAIYLSPAPVALEEVIVKKQRYSKKNNPAVDLMQHIRRTSALNDPSKKPYYNYKTYQRIALALNNIDPKKPNGLVSKFPFLIEHLDTSQISGLPILPISVHEQSSEVHMRSNPENKHTVITGKRGEGIDEILDKESMERFYNDVLGPIDIYARDIILLQNRFVSPLSPIAADFYKFFLTDSIIDSDGRKYYYLSFYPHNKSTFGFSGTLELSQNDSSAFVRSVHMRIMPDINLNFIKNLQISQTYDESPDGSRLIMQDDLIIEAEIIPGTQGLYAHRVIDYSDHNFNRPQNELTVFKPRAPITTLPSASQRDSIFWSNINPAGLSKGESRISLMLNRFRQNKVFYWGEKIIKILVTGYIPTNGIKSKFDVGPMNTTISGNPLEGLRLRAGGITTANLNPHWFTRFYGAYGFKDHRWKYGLELEYSIVPKERHTREFPVHSLRFTSKYDVDRPGQNYAFTNPDNVFLSLHRPGSDPMTYLRHNSLLYTLELETHFSIKASLKNDRQYETRLMPFNLSGGGNIHYFDMSSAEVELRFAPEEKFYQTTSNRFPINLDKPVISLTHVYAPRGLGNFHSVNSTQISFRKRFWFSAFGYLDMLIKGGHVWSKKAPFNYLFFANTNLSYTIQPESFSLTAPMEFIADSYGNLEFTYWANGAILNYIPYLKKLKLREAFGIQAFYGILSSGNDPARTEGLIVWPGYETTANRLKTPYIEASVGIDNILKCLRVDYVWRLTHRHTPIQGAQNWGIRVAFHVTF